jgi:hypothetical protein
MIIITDRRVYHILLKSFKDTFMVMVQWEYPAAMPFTVKTEAMNKRIRELSSDTYIFKAVVVNDFNRYMSNVLSVTSSFNAISKLLIKFPLITVLFLGRQKRGPYESGQRK